MILIENLSYLYTKGGSTLLKSRNGGRSLKIPIGRYRLFDLIGEQINIDKRISMIEIANQNRVSGTMATKGDK